MKSELTKQLETAQAMADKTVSQTKNYIGAAVLRASAMETSYAIGKALEIAKRLDETPAPVNTPPIV